MTKVFAVYQYAWRDPEQSSVALGDGVTAPPVALIGLCRDRARATRAAAKIRRAAIRLGLRRREALVRERATRAAAKIRRATRAAIRLGLRRREALVGVREYDPREFLVQQDRPRVTRREAHALATAGMMARREQLGVR